MEQPKDFYDTPKLPRWRRLRHPSPCAVVGMIVCALIGTLIGFIISVLLVGLGLQILDLIGIWDPIYNFLFEDLIE